MELKEKVKAGIGKAVTYWKQYGAEAALWADLIAVAVLYAMMTAHVPTQNGDKFSHCARAGAVSRLFSAS